MPSGQLSDVQFRYLDGGGRWVTATLAEVEGGAMFVGSPETVARKIVRAVRGLGVQRFDLKYSNGTMPHDQLMDGIRLYGEQVIPRVRELLAMEAAA